MCSKEALIRKRDCNVQMIAARQKRTSRSPIRVLLKLATKHFGGLRNVVWSVDHRAESFRSISPTLTERSVQWLRVESRYQRPQNACDKNDSDEQDRNCPHWLSGPDEKMKNSENDKHMREIDLIAPLPQD